MRNALLVFIICLFALTGCSDNIAAQTSDIMEIREKLFVAQTNDIYMNAADYLGKTIKYEGIFLADEYPDSDDKFYSVTRYGPGCCGLDGVVGFEIIWDGEYPNDNDWVEVIGILEEYEYQDMKFLYLAVSSLTVKTERGSEFVTQ